MSFFNAEDKAIIKINILRKTNKNIYVTLGDSICKGSIDNNLGLITMHTKDGHFDLYEYVNCDLSATFVIYKKLKDE